MDQLVNLYQPVFRQQPKMLSAATLVAIVGAGTLFMLAVYLHTLLSIGGLERTSADLTRTFDLLGAQFDVEASTSESPSGEDAGARIVELQARIDDSRDLLSEIEGLFTDSPTGFVDAFEVLAETPLSGLWLTGVTLDESGHIEISGKTLDPKLVPRYQHLLSRRPSFDRLQRASVSLVREDPESPDVDFVLSYVPPERS